MVAHSINESRRELAGARAFAAVLQQEFDTDFHVFDGDSGERLASDASHWDELSPEAIQECAVANQVRVEHQHAGYLLLLPLPTLGSTKLVAVGAITAMTRTAADSLIEQNRLQHWASAVCERLRQADQLRSHRQNEDDLRSQAKKAWELNLKLERLIRHLRIHRDINVGVHEILESASQSVEAESLIWLPQRGEQQAIQVAPVLGAHDIESLVTVLRRQPELRDRGVSIIEKASDAEWGHRFPSVASVMVFAVPQSNPVGWLVALNKKVTPDVRSLTPSGHVAFRRGDAAALAPFSALLGTLYRANDRYQELKDLLVGLTRALASAVDAKDPYTYGHSERVARIAMELGQELKLSEDQLSDLYLAGLLHDLGKIGIRDEVLCKQGALTPEETDHMRQHPQIGYSILKDLRQISSLLPGVLHHHEQFNGGGYPNGLAGENIPLLARILAVADSYDAMSTTRPYRQALGPARVEQILDEGAGVQWDPRVIAAFQSAIQRIRSIRERGLGESLRQALDGALREDDRGSRHSNMSIGIGTFEARS